MNIFRPLDGYARKLYEEKNGIIKTRFPIGGRFELIEAVRDADLTLSKMADVIRKARQVSGILFPNLPNHGKYDDFVISKRSFLDAPRGIFCADVDSVVIDIDLLLPDLRSTAKRWIKREGLPSNVGFIATWSSSRFVKGINKLSIHIWFLLTDSYNEADLKKLTASLDCDAHMCEKTRFHCVLPPSVEKAEMLSEDYSRYDEMVVVEGERLDLGKVSGTAISNEKLRDHSEELASINWNSATKNLFACWKEYFDDQPKGTPKKYRKIPYKDANRLVKACEKLLQEKRIQHRHNITYWLLKSVYVRGFGTYEILAAIMNSEELMGKHGWKELFDQVDYIKQEFMDQTMGGALQDIFTKAETVEANLESFKDLTDEQVGAFFQPNTISITDAACGIGKSHFLIKRGLDKYDPSSVLSTCHRHAALKQQAREWDLIHGDDIGRENPSFESLSAVDRKVECWPDCDNPAITIQSGHYMLRNGEVKYREIVIIDEIEHVLRELYIKPDQRGERDIYDSNSKNWHFLLTACCQADQVWAADDSATRDITGWFATLLEEHSGKQKRLLRNNIDFVSRMKFREIQSEEDAILTAVHLLNSGKKVFIATDHGDNASRGKLDKYLLAIKELANLEDHEIYGITSKVAANTPQGKRVAEDPSAEIADMMDNGLLCFMMSPVFDCAWSYPLDGFYKFDAIVGLFGHGLTHADDMKQIFRRARLTTDVYFYAKPLPYRPNLNYQKKVA